ncbi:MAG: 6-phosphofructokinase [Armatimonadota bacterium]|nr:6-phosphofructokinase [Armatimonadota bacterium]MDR7437693.1 6-phosphofructokinase [Armatimonadota bacterium]MDR7472394.1 6-phosphofructokinase [Armatimonadota bacterium]MDR7507518.1 6-phosphofructokinase [Armatimonadota bacterium]MDR7509777.1 6-phosphofructokinase [Armatimonadota bacterium]
MPRVGVLTSGGDAPGMNAAIRAVVRTAVVAGWEVVGIRHGYAGLIAGEVVPLTARDVGGIIQLGGTILHSARCPEFQTPEGRRRALATLEEHRIDALVVIGGSGSQCGACELSRAGVRVVGVASTIDNDVYGADITIGVDTALNIALEAVDRLKTTASALQRAFLVEVMGRQCGYLALMTALAGGAESVVIPEVEIHPEQIVEDLRLAAQRGKAHALVVVAEGAAYNAERLIRYFHEHRERLGYELRATILGHVQRGGAPTAFDRLLATRTGAAAVDLLVEGTDGVMVGLRRGEIDTTPLAEVAANKKTLDLRLLSLIRTLAT